MARCVRRHLRLHQALRAARRARQGGCRGTHLILNGTFEALLGVARAEGGDLVKFGGDACSCSSMATVHAERACRAAYGMRAALKARGAVVTDRGRVVLRISMGVHSGPFLFVLAGRRQRELFVARRARDDGDCRWSRRPMPVRSSSATPRRHCCHPRGWVPPRTTACSCAGSRRHLPAARHHGRRHATTSTTAELAVRAAAVRRRLLSGDHDAEHRHATIALRARRRRRRPAARARARPRSPSTSTTWWRSPSRLADRHEVCLLATDAPAAASRSSSPPAFPTPWRTVRVACSPSVEPCIDADVGLPVRVGVQHRSCVRRRGRRAVAPGVHRDGRRREPVGPPDGQGRRRASWSPARSPSSTRPRRSRQHRSSRSW